MAHEWNDDERAKGFKSYRAPVQNEKTISLGVICRDIIKDQTNYKRRLWNEVEYVNYAYEFAQPVVANEYEDEPPAQPTPPTTTTQPANELNSECFDQLVKNQTAYL